MDGDQIRQVPVLDENGKPVMNADGTPVMRDGLKLADEATITARMNAIPHSNYRAVVFTKEQYARIPLRNETVDEHAQDMLIDFVAAGRVASAMESDSHRKEAARDACFPSIQIPAPRRPRNTRISKIWALTA